MRSKQIPHGATQNSAIATAGEVFPDGTVVELVRQAKAGELGLLRWDGTRATMAGHIEYEGRTYVPTALDPTILRAMRFPSRVMPYGSTGALFNDLCGLLTRFINLPEECARKVAYFGLATWPADRVHAAPVLSITASLTSQSMVLLQLLALVCRRALWLGDVNPAALCSLPMHLRPTLLLDEVHLGASFQRLLRASSVEGRYVARNGRTLDLYSPKVICSREPLRDPWLASRALQVALAPTRQRLPLLDRETNEQIADEFQAKLLMYRLTNCHDVCTPSIDVEELTAPTQSLARSLAACVVGDEGLQSALVPLLRQQDREIQVERSAGLESVVLEALLFCCHDGDRSTVRAAELAEITNTILAGRGYSIQVSPETIGWKLKGLGFYTEPICGGKGLYLLDEVRVRIHKWARDHDVPSLQQGPRESCPHCSRAKDVGGEQDG